MSVREDIVAEALTWKGTPFVHRAGVKGHGCDCLFFFLRVYQAVGLVGEVEMPDYPQDWHFHHSEELYLEGVKKYLREVTAPLPGDVALYTFGRTVSHAALVLDWPDCIHAWHRGREVQLVDGLSSAELGGQRLHSFWSPLP